MRLHSSCAFTLLCRLHCVPSGRMLFLSTSSTFLRLGALVLTLPKFTDFGSVEVVEVPDPFVGFVCITDVDAVLKPSRSEKKHEVEAEARPRNLFDW